MKYVLQWPPGVCRTLSPWKQCKRDLNQLFSIHDLWPSNANGAKVSCRKASRTDTTVADVMNQHPDLESELDERWPNFWWEILIEFWAHEWRSHGHCTRFILNGAQYFTAATTIHNNLILPNQGTWNLYDILFSGKIYPDENYYEKNHFRAAFDSIVHDPDNVEVMCRSNKTHDILYEICLSVDPQFQHFVAPTNSAVYGVGDRCVFPGF